VSGNQWKWKNSNREKSCRSNERSQIISNYKKVYVYEEKYPTHTHTQTQQPETLIALIVAAIFYAHAQQRVRCSWAVNRSLNKAGGTGSSYMWLDVNEFDNAPRSPNCNNNGRSGPSWTVPRDHSLSNSRGRAPQEIEISE